MLFGLVAALIKRLRRILLLVRVRGIVVFVVLLLVSQKAAFVYVTHRGLLLLYVKLILEVLVVDVV